MSDTTEPQSASEVLDILGFPVPSQEEEYEEFDNSEQDDGLSAKVLGSEIAWEGGFLRVDQVDLQMLNGAVVTHDVVRHPGAVAIIAIDEENRILLVSQYRTSLERITLEIPAGKLALGEDAETCARRELEEETGYQATTMRYLIPVAVAAGYSDEIIHLFMATGLERGVAHPDEDEFVEACWMELNDLINLVLDGKIEDSKTIIGALICDAIATRL